MTSSHVFFCPQNKHIQLTIINEERNQNIFTFKKLKSENSDIFSFKKTDTKRSIKYGNSWLVILMDDN